MQRFLVSALFLTGAAFARGAEPGDPVVLQPSYRTWHGSNALVALERSGVTLKFNRDFGGTLWELQYGGLQYLNIHDLGRQAQVSGRWTNAGVEHVFSECGTEAVVPLAKATNLLKQMGSICLSAETNGDGVFTSRTTPLEYIAKTARKLGGSPATPVLYRSLRLSKSVTLDYRGIEGCIQWRHSIQAGPDLVNQPWYQHEIVGIHLTCVFSNCFELNLSTGALEDRSAYWSGDSVSKMLKWGDKCSHTCLVLADATRTHAFGLLLRHTRDGGSAETLLGYHWKKLGPYPADGMSVHDRNCIALFGLRHEPFVAGDNFSTAYLFVGNFNTVTNSASKLFAIREQIPWK